MIQVIEVTEHVGTGMADNPVRIAMRYYSPDGCLLASRDDWAALREAKPAGQAD